ncbi:MULTISPECIES: hypothetical protein [Parageobacillus]|uniref:hypothetical protein n=1 Tax=Parageobacillus TaxID=1906945 RepID=UPI0012FDFB09|nr:MULTISPECIES: hypothetical protein [Parageobacillus]
MQRIFTAPVLQPLSAGFQSVRDANRLVAGESESIWGGAIHVRDYRNWRQTN